VLYTLAAAALLALTSAAYAQGDYGLSTQLRPPPRTPAVLDPRSITVKFRPGIERTRSADVIQAAGCQVGFASRFTPGLMDLRLPAGADYRDYVQRFAARLDIEYAHPMYIDHPFFTPNDPFFDLQWHFKQIGLPTAWDILPSRGSSSIIVCVQDTGVAYQDYLTFTRAPDLAGVTFVSPYDAEDLDGHPNDVNGHGSHVTGTIAQKTNNALGVAGTADGVKIMPVRTLGGSGSHTVFSDGVHWAVDHGAKIINYSGGGSDSPTKHDAVIYANSAGVLYIAAMGNDGVVNPPAGFPGRYAEAMGVVATDYGKSKAPYSNWGANADISAPGGDTTADLNADGYADGVLQQTYVTTDDPTSGFNYQFWQGTSMATPHVSGLAALIWSQGRFTTAASVRSRIESTAEDRGAAGKDSTFGWGIIRADRALGPWLSWTGAAGYTADGVDPESGDAVAAGTTFHYRVKYLDGTGAAPTQARVRIERLLCGASGGVIWTFWQNKTMTLESGSIANGAIYHVGTTLPTNHTYRYKFEFKDGAGATVGGAPSLQTLGPKINRPPYLCWTGLTNFTTDGVNPGSGPAGTRFTFKVLYVDSAGTAPTVKELRLKRNGATWGTRVLSAASGGSYREGKIYNVSVTLSEVGSYEYRFVLNDGSGEATGAPASFKSGPTVGDGGASAGLTALAAVPTSAGAQITFNLAAAADVTATITNVAGRPVRVLAQDRPLQAGLQTLLWDRRADSGLAAPAGIYLIRVVARSPEGGQSSALASLSVR
jgi:serine protease